MIETEILEVCFLPEVGLVKDPETVPEVVDWLKKFRNETLFSLVNTIEGSRQLLRTIEDEYISADSILTAEFSEEISVVADDLTALASSVTTLTATVNGNTSSISVNAAAIATIEGHLEASYAIILDVNDRVSGLYLLNDGTETSIKFLQDSFEIYDGITDRPLFSAIGGIVTIEGDLEVSGSIQVGGVRLLVGLQTIEFSKEDGETIEWAGGETLGSVPQYSLNWMAVAPLASGEQYDIRLTSITAIGATLRAKIATPGTTTPESETTDAAGGGGDPDRVMHKPSSLDAYNGVYQFTISGTVDVTSFTGGGGIWVHIGSVTISTWFDDSGGWDEGPEITVTAADLLGYSSGSDETGSHAFELTFPIEWANAIGQHGGEEFGASHEGGGSLTDIDEIAYTTQTTSGERSATPDGEKVKITVYPRNA